MDWGMKIVDVVLSVNSCVDCLDAWGPCVKKGLCGGNSQNESLHALQAAIRTVSTQSQRGTAIPRCRADLIAAWRVS
jgi:hypothetical protein